MTCAGMGLESLQIIGIPATQSVILGKRLRHYSQHSTHLYLWEGTKIYVLSEISHTYLMSVVMSS